MRTLYATTTTLAALAVAAPTAGTAQEFGVNAGFAVVSEYVSQGLKFSDGPAVQPYVELSYGGLYGGVWATNGDENLLFADSEVDYYIGYRGEVDAFYYDFAVDYYTFQDSTFPPPDDTISYEEYLISAGYAVNLQLYVTGNVAYAPEFETTDLSVDVDYFTNLPGLAIAASYGSVSSAIDGADEWNYWSFGGTYALTDNITLDLTYHDSDETGDFIEGADGLIVAMLSFDY